MNPEHVSPAPSPSKPKPSVRREGELDAGEQLGDTSLQGVNVTEDDLMKLVEELGLGGADADELVKGLRGEETSKEEAPVSTSVEEAKVEGSAKGVDEEASERVGKDAKPMSESSLKVESKAAGESTKPKDI